MRGKKYRAKAKVGGWSISVWNKPIPPWPAWWGPVPEIRVALTKPGPTKPRRWSIGPFKVTLGPAFGQTVTMVEPSLRVRIPKELL